MNILTLFIIIPVLTMIGLMSCRDKKHVKIVAAIGMSAQLINAAVLILSFLYQRHIGNTEQMLFTQNYLWYKSLNIHFAIGVDGISVAMIGLTSLIIFAGVFASWGIEDLPKEFFTSLILLSTGVFGFFHFH